MSTIIKHLCGAEIIELLCLKTVNLSGGRLFKTLSSLLAVEAHLPFVAELVQYALGVVSEEEGYLRYLGEGSFTDHELFLLEKTQQDIGLMLSTDEVDGHTATVTIAGSLIRVTFTLHRLEPVQHDTCFYQELKNGIENGDYIPPRLRSLVGQ